MKRSMHTAANLSLLFAILLFSSCSKDKTPGGGGQPTLNILYPATYVFSQSGNGNYPFPGTYEYDSNNNLKKYGKDGNAVREVSTHGVSSIVWNGDNLQMFSYAFRMYDNPGQAINIYNGKPPTEVSVDIFNKNLVSGVTSSSHYNDFQFTNYSNGLLQTEIAFRRNYNYSYDDDLNLKKIEYTENGSVYTRMIVESLDKNPSPFVAVKGYRYASYPQVYVPEIVAAYCHNNPIRVIVESLNPDNNRWELYEENDFTYVYNEEGYPTTVNLTITYHTATVSKFTKKWVYTYRK